MVVGRTTIKPGEKGNLKVSVMMHEGMGGPHLFHLLVRSSDTENPLTILKVRANFVSLDQWRRSRPDAFFLPRKVGRFALTSETTGPDVMRYAARILQGSHDPKDAYLGMYRMAANQKAKQGARKKREQIRLLCVEFEDPSSASRGLSGILSKIKTIRKGGPRLRRVDMRGTVVYSTTRAPTTTFLFQVDRRLVILSSDLPEGEKFLGEVMRFLNR